ncbi:hypothetical protein GCM10009846_04440 [Agrococcus versicolor]|uniref:Uncharacterized protein n=1 Tax=Agrococcus versicolor TaxID=501482 RepID=A0ABP5M9Y5_9MICO
MPEDAPDPAIAACATARTLPVAVRSLVVQPSLERIPHPSVSSSGAAGEQPASMEVAWSYTLWRVPGDRDDPANLADLDERTRASLDDVPPWPRPAWLLDVVERLRRPMLWEAVRTSWERDRDAGEAEVVGALVEHLASVLVNGFDEERGPGARWDRPELVAPGSVRAAEVVVDGRAWPGVAIEGDRHVLGLGVALPDGAIVTAALPRDALAHLQVAFASVVP